jgi:hypothetical protein
MKFFAQAAALVLLSASQVQVAAGHRHTHAHLKRHTHSHHGPRSMAEGPLSQESPALEKKSVRCSLPKDDDLVYVPGAMNNGFAMSPDQECTPGKYCPIACRSGKVMAQWEPGSSYTFPSSMNGGLLCNADGTVSKPFPDKPYCVEGTGAISVSNTAGKSLSFCQTVLPGNEAMLIPTVISGKNTIAVPGPSYWCSTSAHYYVNPPGVTEEGCIWGDSSRPVGNWAPYIAGANTDATGNTYVTLGSNPIFEKEGNGLEKSKPSYGMRVKCTGGGCNGLPCEVGAADAAVGQVKSNLQAVGAGGASFCVVTVPAGSHAEIEIFNTDGTTYAGSAAGSDTATKSKGSGGSSTADAAAAASSSKTSSPDGYGDGAKPTLRPGIFHENGTTTGESTAVTTASSPSSETAKGSTSSTSDLAKGESGPRQQGSAAISGLIVALVATAFFY